MLRFVWQFLLHMDYSPVLEKSLGGGHGDPLQYSCLENPMDRGAWWATVHRVAKSPTRLKLLCSTGGGKDDFQRS